jgi:hypothetical protein
MLAAALTDFGIELGLQFESRDWLESILNRVEPEPTRRYAHAARRSCSLTLALTWSYTSPQP